MKNSQTRTNEIPDRVYFRIGEVSSIVGVDPHVLRYWETEFKILKPRRAPSKQRLYRKKDVLNLLRIRTLLHDEGYTIAGARRLLKESGEKTNLPTQEKPKSADVNTNKEIQGLKAVKQELQEIVDSYFSPL